MSEQMPQSIKPNLIRALWIACPVFIVASALLALAFLYFVHGFSPLFLFERWDERVTMIFVEALFKIICLCLLYCIAFFVFLSGEASTSGLTARDTMGKKVFVNWSSLTSATPVNYLLGFPIITLISSGSQRRIWITERIIDNEYYRSASFLQNT